MGLLNHSQLSRIQLNRTHQGQPSPLPGLGTSIGGPPDLTPNRPTGKELQ
jgi:hypothetical protein